MVWFCCAFSTTEDRFDAVAVEIKGKEVDDSLFPPPPPPVPVPPTSQLIISSILFPETNNE
eukprot:15362067-Ditylum_brightwellii.AAC.1